MDKIQIVNDSVCNMSFPEVCRIALRNDLLWSET